ncbi:MAG: siderophore ABC transporter substrate-binding protein [Rhizobiaceae bacterium]|nr:siderophore ABC transporter substrate-binding protein [Rhizobiaceae bacterium]
MKLFGLLPALFAGTFAFQAWAADIDTAAGRVAIEGVPSRIAVFDIAALDTLDRLGIRPAGVPDDLYVPRLQRMRQGAEIVGNIFEPDLEALSALEPDLIVIGGRSSPQMKPLSQLAPTIDMTVDGDDLVAQALHRLAAYGALFGKADDAARIAAELDRSLRAARGAVAGKGTALIVMTSGPKVTAYGKGSRFGWVHASLDLPAAVEDVESATHGEAISFEFIRAANPDWLIVLDRAAAIGSDEQNARATLDNELVAATTAWRKGQVVYLPAAEFYIAAGGIQSLTKVLAAITDAFSRTR